MNENMKILIRRKRLMLKRPFKLAHGTYEYRENIFYIIYYKSFIGIGEAPVVPYYGHTPLLIEKDLSGVSEKVLKRLLNQGVEGVKTMPARNAVETALLDILSQISGKSMREILTVPENELPPTSYTVTGGTFKELKEAASEFPSTIVKIKAGAGDDVKILKEFRQNFPYYTIRVDVNQGWSLDEALRKVLLLQNTGIELIEEPLRGTFKEIQSITEKSRIPVFLDESFQKEEDLYRLVDEAPGVKGIVVKLAKSGGPLRTLSLIRKACEYGFEIMMSSMVESSAGVSAAAVLAPLCRFIDLDSPLLFKDDPFELITYQGNRLNLCNEDLRIQKIQEASAEFFKYS